MFDHFCKIFHTIYGHQLNSVYCPMKLCVSILGASNPSILNGTLKNIPSGKHTKNNGKSPCFMGKSTISMAISNSYVSLPGRVSQFHQAIPKAQDTEVRCLDDSHRVQQGVSEQQPGQKEDHLWGATSADHLPE